jgi:hypothetical protein
MDMAKASAGDRSYRCFYTPRAQGGYPVATDNGILPFVQLRAENAERAQRAAHHVTGCPVADVQRIEHAS